MNTKKLTAAALISCLAYLVTFVFKIPVQFLSYEIKDVVIAIGGIYLGGIYGIIISFVVSIIEMITISDSGIIGFFMNFLSTVSYIIPIMFMYNKNKSMLKGVILATISMSVVMFVFNIFITPLYLGVPLKETVGLLFTLISPFNLVKGLINGIVILILYKPILKTLNKIM